MKRNHFLICSRFLGLGNEILSYVGSFNISAYDDGGEKKVNDKRQQSSSPGDKNRNKTTCRHGNAP